MTTRGRKEVRLADAVGHEKHGLLHAAPDPTFRSTSCRRVTHRARRRASSIMRISAGSNESAPRDAQALAHSTGHFRGGKRVLEASSLTSSSTALEFSRARIAGPSASSGSPTFSRTVRQEENCVFKHQPDLMPFAACSIIGSFDQDLAAARLHSSQPSPENGRLSQAACPMMQRKPSSAPQAILFPARRHGLAWMQRPD